jgi:hypothetical protein
MFEISKYLQCIQEFGEFCKIFSVLNKGTLTRIAGFFNEILETLRWILAGFKELKNYFYF